MILPKRDNHGSVNLRVTLLGWDLLRFERMVMSAGDRNNHYYGVKILWIKVMFWSPLFDLCVTSQCQRTKK